MYLHHRDLLDNGLRVVTLEVPHLHSAVVAAYVRCGSRHETPQNNGVSHFLEHMFFRGSESFPDTRVMNGLVEDAGGSLNGVTMRDQGFYYTPIHPRHLDVAFEVLGDILCAPRLEGIELEREVILEEMQDEVDSRGRDIDPANLTKRLAFGDHPLAYKIAGTLDSVRHLSVNDLRAHHRRFYSAANMVVVAAGPVSRSRVLELAAKAFSPLPRGERAHEEAPAPGPRGPRLVFVPHDESQTELQLTFPCAHEGHPLHLPLLLARSVLDDGLTSWLALEVVERRGLAYSIHGVLDAYEDAGLFEIEAACTPSKVIGLVEEVGRLLARLCEEPLDAGELERVKRRHRIGLDFMLDDLNGLAGWYGATELFREPERLEDRIAKLEAVTAEEIQKAARETFRKSRLYACAVGRNRGRAEERLQAALERLPLKG